MIKEQFFPTTIYGKDVKLDNQLFANEIVEWSKRDPGVQKTNVKRHFHYRILPAKMAGFVHVKQYIVDGDYAVSGSANFSKTGLWNNHESITIYQGMSNARVIEDQFDRIWNSTKTA